MLGQTLTGPFSDTVLTMMIDHVIVYSYPLLRQTHVTYTVYIYIHTGIYIYTHTMHMYIYIYIYILHTCKSLTTIIIWIGILKVNMTCVMVRFDQDASNIGSICSYYLFFRLNLHNFSGEVLTTGYELRCVQCSRFLVMHRHVFFCKMWYLLFSMQPRRSEPKLKI